MVRENFGDLKGLLNEIYHNSQSNTGNLSASEVHLVRTILLNNNDAMIINNLKQLIQIVEKPDKSFAYKLQKLIKYFIYGVFTSSFVILLSYCAYWAISCLYSTMNPATEVTLIFKAFQIVFEKIANFGK